MSRLLALGLVVVAVGCGVDVVPPPVSSVGELRGLTLKQLEKLDQAVAENKVVAGDIKQLAVSINYLRGHMRTTNVGTREQFQALDEILYRLAQIGGGADRPPAHWRPGQEGQPPPPPIIAPGPMKELLPQIRKVVESVPNSDARPNIKGPRQQ